MTHCLWLDTLFKYTWNTVCCQMLDRQVHTRRWKLRIIFIANFTIHIMELRSRLTLFHHIISYFHKQHQHHRNGRVFLMCIRYGSQEYVPQIHHSMVVVSKYCDCLVHNMHYIVFCMLQSVINNYDLQGITYNKCKKLTITMSSDIL